jgi:hypothetical protein
VGSTRESARTYLSGKEMAAKMGRKKPANLHKYNSTKEKKTSICTTVEGIR